MKKIILIAFVFYTNLIFSQVSEVNCEIARKKYLEQNPDVAAARMDAWVHYNGYGRSEGRKWPNCNTEPQKNSDMGKTFPNSKKIGNYEFVVSNDKMSWTEVNNYCNQLGKEWFLPSKTQMIILIETFSFDKEKIYWTSNEGTSGNSKVYAGKQWTNNDYDVADALDLKTKTTISMYKNERAYFVVARSLGNGFDIVKSNLYDTYSIGELKVSKYELKNVTYNQAKSLCNNLGEGWRIPTIEELETIKNNGRSCEKDLSSCYYYSDTRSCAGCYDSYFALSFVSGQKMTFVNDSYLRVVPVYSVPKPKLETMKFYGFEVCTNIYGPMTYRDADLFCLKMSDNKNRQWRVTTDSELTSVKNYKSEIPNMVGKTFMSYSPGEKTYFSRDFLDTVEIAPLGQSERYWQGGSEDGKYYFFMSRKL
jgi:hypothetical protein